MKQKPFYISTLLWISCLAGLVSAQNVTLPKDKIPQGKDIVDAARSQIGKTVEYDPSYVVLKYPNGDLPIEKGVCTDVVIRALRKARQLDLQKLVHKDMRAHFSRYPKNWGLKRTDRNIDHRRVPNLKTYFKRCGWQLPISKKTKIISQVI